MQESLICSISTLKQRMGSFMHARASAFVPLRKMFKAHRTSRLQKHPHFFPGIGSRRRACFPLASDTGGPADFGSNDDVYASWTVIVVISSYIWSMRLNPIPGVTTGAWCFKLGLRPQFPYIRITTCSFPASPFLPYFSLILSANALSDAPLLLQGVKRIARNKQLPPVNGFINVSRRFSHCYIRSELYQVDRFGCQVSFGQFSL